MARIDIKSTTSDGVKKRIFNLKKYLEKDLPKEAFAKSENKIQTKWKKDIPNIFGVRSSMGLPCDGILAKSLAIVRRSNSIIVFVEPITRYSKNTMSSGGMVRNLTTILFRGSNSSVGAYKPKWDARVKTGRHPGTSPSTMRNYWNIFKKYVREEIRRGIREGIKSKSRGKK